MKKVISQLISLEKQKDIWVVIAMVVVFILLRIPSLIEPDWYGDEGIYRTIGIAISSGSQLYKDIWDNKPPLLYIIYALSPDSLFFPKFLSLIVGVASVIVFFMLSSFLFAKSIAKYISTAFFTLLFATPYLEGNIANAENFMILPILIAFYLMLSKKTITKKHYLLAGIFLGIAFIFKSVAIFDFAAIFVIYVILQLKKNQFGLLQTLSENRRYLKLYFVGFIIPFILTSIFFLFKGYLGEFLSSAYFSNVDYVEFSNYFIIPHGLILIKTAGLLFGLFCIFYFRKYISFKTLVIYVWLLFGIYSSFFTQRPYTHYLLMLLPSFSLLVGYIFSQKKMVLFHIGVIFAVYYLVIINFTPYKKNIAYYKNYIAYILGDKNTISYQAFFDKNTPRDYALASYILSSTKPDESVFLWSDSAQIYALSNKIPPVKYITSYHIRPYKDRLDETINTIDNKKVKYIIVTSKTDEIQTILDSYQYKFSLENATVYEKKF